ncbi:STAS domain-containing protein [Halobacillus fulvus]|nr:STAS domain-containing protein [Halobacillus fulvus]
MNSELMYIGEKIRGNQDLLSERVEKVKLEEGAELGSLRFKEKKQELFEYLGALLVDEESEKSMQVWAREMGQIALEEGFELDHILYTFSVTRRAVWYIFEEEIERKHFTTETVLDVNKKISPVLDDVTYYISQIYMEEQKKEWTKTQAVLAELSAPVVPVLEGVAILTVIGEVDTSRAQILMENSLNESSRLKLNHLLIDVSGVPVIDTEVAHNLFQIVKSLELVGVKTLLTGMRPEIARAVVEMGIEFKHVKTKANLQQALADIGFFQEKR